MPSKQSGAAKRAKAKARVEAEAAAQSTGQGSETPEVPTASDSYIFRGRALLLTWQLEKDVDLHAIKKWLGVVEDSWMDKDPNEILAPPGLRDHLNKWSVCVEQGSHLHAHAFLCFSDKVELRRSQFLLPEKMSTGVRIDPNTARGPAFVKACDRGHFYVYCRYKTTHIASATNYHPGRDYKVCLDWIDNLWCTHKVDRALECALEYRVCTPQFEARYQKIMAARGLQARQAFHEKRAAALASGCKPFRQIPEVIAWLDTFNQIRGRYKFLVLHGESQLGKTWYAKSLFRNPFVAESAFDFDGYEPTEHDGLVLEDIADIRDHINKNKTFFKAETVCKIHKSATNCYAKLVDTAQKPIVICCNADVWRQLECDAWIQLNMVAVHIDTPTWIDDAGPIVLDTVPDGVARLEFRDTTEPPSKKNRRQ
jgi:effector-binding domain-containing protein